MDKVFAAVLVFVGFLGLSAIAYKIHPSVAVAVGHVILAILFLVLSISAQ